MFQTVMRHCSFKGVDSINTEYQPEVKLIYPRFIPIEKEIAILVETAKHPDFSVSEIQNELKKQQTSISTTAIYNVWERNKIPTDKKKLEFSKEVTEHSDSKIKVDLKKIKRMIEENRYQIPIKATPHLPIEIDEAVLDATAKHPDYGLESIADEVSKQGLYISPGGVKCVLKRYKLLKPEQQYNYAIKRAEKEKPGSSEKYKGMAFAKRGRGPNTGGGKIMSPQTEDALVNATINYPKYKASALSRKLQEDGVEIPYYRIRAYWKDNNLETKEKRIEFSNDALDGYAKLINALDSKFY